MPRDEIRKSARHSRSTNPDDHTLGLGVGQQGGELEEREIKRISQKTLCWTVTMRRWQDCQTHCEQREDRFPPSGKPEQKPACYPNYDKGLHNPQQTLTHRMLISLKLYLHCLKALLKVSTLKYISLYSFIKFQKLFLYFRISVPIKCTLYVCTFLFPMSPSNTYQIV